MDLLYLSHLTLHISLFAETKCVNSCTNLQQLTRLLLNESYDIWRELLIMVFLINFVLYVWKHIWMLIMLRPVSLLIVALLEAFVFILFIVPYIGVLRKIVLYITRELKQNLVNLHILSWDFVASVIIHRFGCLSINSTYLLWQN